MLTVLGEAERFGAICANRLQVTQVGSRQDLSAGVTVRDHESGAEFVIRADNVVNATGVWADQIRPDELHSEAEVPQIAPSRGTHITLSSGLTCRCARARSCRPATGARSSPCRGWDAA